MATRSQAPGARWTMPKDDDDPFEGGEAQPPREIGYGTDWEVPPTHNRTAVVPPVGVYIVQLEGMYQEDENRFNPEVPRIRFEWRMLKVIDADDRAEADGFVGQIIHSWCNLSMGPRATMRAWGEALFGREFEDEERPPKAEWIGKMAKASYVEYTKESRQKGVKLGSLSRYTRPERPGASTASAADARAMSGKPATPPTPAARTAPPRQVTLSDRSVDPPRQPTLPPDPASLLGDDEPWDEDDQ